MAPEKGLLLQMGWMRHASRNVLKRLMKNLRGMCSLTGCPRPRTPGQESQSQGATSMRFRQFFRAALFLPLILGSLAVAPANADGNLKKVKHVVVIMQENHSFDNYFGALAYAPGSPYHSPRREDGDDHDGGCPKGDHSCVDGLSCRVDAAGNFTCRNATATMMAAPCLLSMIRAVAWLPI